MVRKQISIINSGEEVYKKHGVAETEGDEFDAEVDEEFVISANVMKAIVDIVEM